MRLASLLQWMRRSPRYSSVGNSINTLGSARRENEVQSSNMANVIGGARRGRWIVIVALLALQLSAGAHSISSSISSDDTPRFLEIPSTPPPPLARPFKYLTSIPSRIAVLELLKLLINALLYMLLHRSHAGGYSMKRHAVSSPLTRINTGHEGRERRSTSLSRAIAPRHGRSTRSPSIVNGSITARGAMMGSRSTLLWDAQTEAERGSVDERLQEERESRPLVSSTSHEVADELKEEFEWDEDHDVGRRIHMHPSFSLGTTRSSIALCLVATVMLGRMYLTLVATKFVDAIGLYLTSPFVGIIVAVLSTSLLSNSLSLLQWQSIALQICAVFLAESRRVAASGEPTAVILLEGITIVAAVSLVSLEYVLKGHEVPATPFRVNVFLSLASLSLSLGAVLVALFSGVSVDELKQGIPALNVLGPLLLHASTDVVGILLVFYYDAVMFCLTHTCATALLMLYTHWCLQSMTLVEMGGAALAILAFVVFVTDFRVCIERRKSNRFRTALGIAATITALLYIVPPLINFDLLPLPSSALTIAEPPTFADYVFIPIPPKREPVCTREELPSFSFYSGNRIYHEFDDVLLVVFFSHARYDVNLDYYKEVYSEYFPNMVFIGPGNREDIGFAHSYDVIVDSYQAVEDLSDPSYYKMSGRMAHHMLYTVLRDPKYACYAGYLWAPFDTLLNIPRLQQFDQNRVWYHSPFAEFVPNPALNVSLPPRINDMNETSENALANDEGEIVAEMGKRPSAESAAWADNEKEEEEEEEEYAGERTNRTKKLEWKLHAPPLMISPNPSVNWTATYKGWWVDWWWGEPHMGLSVCMRAFRRASQEQRARLSALTNGTRLLGGSADTLYIPRRLRSSFLETLGLFLDTDCFLEIAVPSAVHLVLEEGEKIQYVDHWWIFRPPFNVTFVRDKWKRGYEVDTFHTFHWGDKGEDGVWRGNRKNIADMRDLLSDSAIRQGINLTTGERIS